jgi:WD40 repeat protein
MLRFLTVAFVLQSRNWMRRMSIDITWRPTAAVRKRFDHDKWHWVTYSFLLTFTLPSIVAAQTPIQLASKIELPHTYIGSLHFSPDGALLVTAGSNENSASDNEAELKANMCPLDSDVIVWDARTWRRHRQVAFPAKGILSVSFSPGGATVACGFFSGTVKLLDIETGAVSLLAPDAGQVVKFAPKGNVDVLAASAFGQRVTLWNVGTGALLASFEPNDKFANVGRPIAWSPDGRKLAIVQVVGKSQEGNEVELYDIPAFEQAATLRSESAKVASLCFSADGLRLYALAYDGVVVVWDVASRQVLTRFQAIRQAQHDQLGQITLSDDGKLLATPGRDLVALWTADGQKLVATIGDGSGRGYCVVDFSPGGQHVAVAKFPADSERSQLEVWEIDGKAIP